MKVAVKIISIIMHRKVIVFFNEVFAVLFVDEYFLVKKCT